MSIYNNIKNSSGKLKATDFLFSLFLFLVVYNPPIYKGVSFTIAAIVISLVYCILNMKEVGSLYANKDIRKSLNYLLFFIVYVIFVSLANLGGGGDNQILGNIFSDLSGYLSLLVVSFGITIYAIKKGWCLDKLIKLYIVAAFIQGVIGLACVASPGIKSFFVGLMGENSNSERISTIIQYTSTYRNFGFASTLYDIFGMTMSICTLLAILIGLKERKFIYFIFALLIAVVAIVNARTSIVIIFIGCLLLFFSQNRSGGKVKGFIAASVVLLMGVFFISNAGSFIQGNSESAIWLLQGINEINAFSSGSNEGYFDVLINEFIFFPDSLMSTVFGTGLLPDQAIHKGSDVGYIKHIWQYGIIGTSFIVYVYYRIFHFASKKQQWPFSSIFTILFILIAIYLVKLTCLGYSMVGVVVIPLCFFSMAQSRRIMIVK